MDRLYVPVGFAATEEGAKVIANDGLHMGASQCEPEDVHVRHVRQAVWCVLVPHDTVCRASFQFGFCGCHARPLYTFRLEEAA